MPLHIEQVVDDLIAQLQTFLPTQIAAVLAETDSKIALVPPANRSYFVGEPSRFRAYEKPCCFVITNKTSRTVDASREGFGTVLYQEHSLTLDLVLEGTDEQQLTRACWRMAQALDNTVRDQDITPPGIETRSVKTFVTGIDYGVLFTGRDHPEQRIFAKDIMMDLLIKHWDLRTPMAVGPNTDWQ